MKPSPSILIVDDEPANLRYMNALLRSDGFTPVMARNAEETFEKIALSPPDLILLDVNMPGMNGFEIAHRLKNDSSTRNIPIIMVTSLDDRSSRLTALQHGAEEFLSKPIDSLELKVRVRNLLRLKEYQDFLALHNRVLEQQVYERTEALNTAYHDTINTLVRAAEFRDEGTGAHVKRISHYCHELSSYLGMDGVFCDEIFHASPMHDIGKIGIPDAVLNKPGAFNPHESNIMRAHCTLGANILENGHSPYTRMGAQIALNHHECWDGTGYPIGKIGEEIPLPARIMSLADRYDALRAQRPYKSAWSHQTAMDILINGDKRSSPEHFDPAILSCFSKNADVWDQIYSELTEDEHKQLDSSISAKSLL